MPDTRDGAESGLSGAGRYIAVATELPCMVIAFLFVGQIVGQSVYGINGGVWGGILGAIIGLFFGAYSVYLTLTKVDAMAAHAHYRPTYTPPLSEILEEPEFVRREDIDSPH